MPQQKKEQILIIRYNNGTGRAVQGSCDLKEGGLNLSEKLRSHYKMVSSGITTNYYEVRNGTAGNSCSFILIRYMPWACM